MPERYRAALVGETAAGVSKREDGRRGWQAVSASEFLANLSIIYSTHEAGCLFPVAPILGD